MDRQQSLHELRQLDLEDSSSFSFDVETMNLNDFYNEVERLDELYDLIFIDTGGKLDNNLPFDQQEITPLLLNTDLLLVPFVAGNFGTDATLKYLEYVVNVKQLKKQQGQDLGVLGFVNMHIKNRKEDSQLESFLGEIASETGLKFMQNKLGFYSAYRGADTLVSLYKEKTNNAQERNFKLWIKELNNSL